jgi:hypothetical protein
MQAHTLCQISFLDQNENHKISDRDSDEVFNGGPLLLPAMPVSMFDSNACTTLTQSAMEGYTHAMQAYALSQISSLDLSEDFEISDKDSDDVPNKGVLYQGPGPPNAAETEEAARLAANAAERIHV